MSIRAYIILLSAVVFASCNADLLKNETVQVSPISDTLLYNSFESGAFQVYSLAGGTFTRLINDDNYDYWWIRISPNGKKFLCYRSTNSNFFKENDYNNAELWMFNIDGSGGKMLLSKGANNWRSQGYATWMPNGKNIVMAAEVKDPADNDNYRWHLFVADTLGGIPHKVSNRVGLFSNPEVGTTGTTIVYSAFPFNKESGSVFDQELFVATLDTNTWALQNEKQLTDDNYWDREPALSPDGQSIVFSSATSQANLFENVNLRKITFGADTAVSTLINGVQAYDSPVWSADGTYLYIQYRLSQQTSYAIARINADGTGLIQVIRNEAADLINPRIK